MALTRKFLSALGIESDKIDQIIEAHSETVDALKEQRDQSAADAEKYKADAEKLEAVQKELDGLKVASGDNMKYKEKYEKEKADFEAYKNGIAEKESAAKKADAYKALLKAAGVPEKHLNAVLKASDLSGVELDEEGAVKDADKASEAIKNEWSDLIPTASTKGADTATPPSNGGEKPHGSGYARARAEAFYKSRYGIQSGRDEGKGGKE